MGELFGDRSGNAAPAALTSGLAALEKLCAMPEENQRRIDGLRRCSRCILPETFPFIEFDEQGVCNYCRAYQPLTFLGKDALEAKLAPLRGGNGTPDCLLPLSGGRDSSYALHYAVRELGLQPVAYTYDWGMVTDLARRNIARMCGELGVKHVMVTANIARKRANIRKNVLAWLHKPHLGTVSLFMAGDKQYFYYAWLLRKKLGLRFSIHGDNRLERTDFKVGFCGIQEKEKRQQHYALSIRDKLNLLAFFGKKFIETPQYLNNSMLDSFFGFLSYYAIPKTFFSLYEYIEWDEYIINNTLQSLYAWESAKDTQSTWRIGDGTASFYNYIFYRIAGFSENDTFRSNQIREKIISRAEAAALAQRDNRARLESIKLYCDTIGIDVTQTISRINSVPQLY